jgi:peroxin-16
MLNKIQEAYENAILESSSTLTSVENGLRQLTWFLPGRFEDAEIASEGREYSWHIALYLLATNSS